MTENQSLINCLKRQIVLATVVVGEGVTRGVTTAGSIDAYNEDGAANILPLGDVMSVGATTEYSLINLNIP